MGTIGSGDGDANYSRDLLPRPKSTSPDVVSGGGRELEVIDGATARLDEAESGGNVIQTDTDDRDSQYRLGRQVGKGSFGVIFVATRLSDGKQFAFKFERRGSDASQLRNEYRVYKALASCEGFPIAYSLTEQRLHNILIMDLLGPSIEELFFECGRSFTVKTVAMVAKQMLSRVEAVHENDFVCRDIKPDNFLIGRREMKTADVIHLVDLGMAHQYRNPKTKKHIPLIKGTMLVGTPRYMSINAHLGWELSRRDDLEGLGYVFIYLLKGGLPWQGMQGLKEREKVNRIGEKKRVVEIEDLCKGLPNELGTYLKYVRSLEFEDTPDYKYLRELFTPLENVGERFDWEHKQSEIISNNTTSGRGRETNIAMHTREGPTLGSGSRIDGEESQQMVTRDGHRKRLRTGTVSGDRS